MTLVVGSSGVGVLLVEDFENVVEDFEKAAKFS
jgi:hypothetical protein